MNNTAATTVVPDDAKKEKQYLCWTYVVTIIMLLIGQLQVVGSMQWNALKEFLQEYYYVSLFNFYMSFLSLQLYVFFYHMIELRPKFVRFIIAFYTYEINTICIMKPTMAAPNLSLGMSFIIVYLCMGMSAVWGTLLSKFYDGCYLSRDKLVMWSARVYVVTCFGIIVAVEMHAVYIVFGTLITYTAISNVFVIIFASSMRRRNFYNLQSSDWLLIGQLYYLNFYALYMSYVWTTAIGIMIFYPEEATSLKK